MFPQHAFRYRLFPQRPERRVWQRRRATGRLKRSRPQGAPTHRDAVPVPAEEPANEMLPTWLALAGVAVGFLLGLGLATEAGRAALATATADEIVRIGLTAMLVAAVMSWSGERLGEGLLARRIDPS